MFDLIVDGWAEISYHVRSRPRTICPRLDQGPISHADGLAIINFGLVCRKLSYSQPTLQIYIFYILTA
jgi:hypothetical protein